MEYIKRTYFTPLDCDINLITEVAGTPPTNEILRNLGLRLNNKYMYHWIIFTDNIITDCSADVEAEPDINKVTQWKARLHVILEDTKDKYTKLIELYKQQENNLLNKIGSSTTTKFNDTPQNANVGDTDEYTSTYTNVSTEVDPGEVITRLNNIRQNYMNVYEVWVKEFDGLFGESTLI